MHVLIVPSWYPTEKMPIYGIFFQEQALALQKYGHKVTVAHPEIWGISTIGQHEQPSGLSFEVEEGVPTYRYRGYNFIPKLQSAGARLFYRRLRKMYARVLKERGKPDIIHAHSCIWGGFAAAKLAKEEGIPFVVTEHSSYIGRDIIKPAQKPFIKATLDQAKKVIVVGEGLVNALTPYTSPENIILIPNIVNTDDFYSDIKMKDTSNKPFTFLSVALLTRNKGMDILIRSFTEMFKGKQVELIIGGDGEERSALENMARDLKIDNQIHFMGRLSRDQVREQMQKCDAFVLASRYETFGIVYIEALACGKPIIATACGGPEYIVNERNGLLVPIEDVKALGVAMNTIVENITMYDPQIIREDCINRFSEKAIAKQITSVYENIT